MRKERGRWGRIGSSTEEEEKGENSGPDFGVSGFNISQFVWIRAASSGGCKRQKEKLHKYVVMRLGT